jgi:hypothetical protein
MHLSILIPGGKGAGNGWGFDREFYPHRRAFDKDFLPGCGRFPIRHNSTCDFSTKALEPRIEKTGNFLFLFLLRFCLLAFWNLNTVHSLDSGDKIYDAQTLFVALYIKC